MLHCIEATGSHYHAGHDQRSATCLRRLFSLSSERPYNTILTGTNSGQRLEYSKTPTTATNLARLGKALAGHPLNPSRPKPPGDNRPKVCALLNCRGSQTITIAYFFRFGAEPYVWYYIDIKFKRKYIEFAILWLNINNRYNCFRLEVDYIYLYLCWFFDFPSGTSSPNRPKFNKAHDIVPRR